MAQDTPPAGNAVDWFVDRHIREGRGDVAGVS